MAKGNGGMSRANYPNSPAAISKSSKSAHCPFGPSMLPQSEQGRDQIKGAHGNIEDHGTLHRGSKQKYSKASPLDGSVDLPYTPNSQDDF